MEPTRERSRLAQARQIDDICNQFEADWLAGKSPKLWEVMQSVDESVRGELLRALLPVELELLAREGKRPAEAGYRTQFPAHSQVVSEVFANPASRRGDAASRDTSVTGSSVRTPDRVSPPTAEYLGSKGGAAPSAPTLKIGRFEVLAVLGEGAFGKVYRARDPKLDREVAIKVPLPGVVVSERDLQRLVGEAKAAATVQHPNICPVYEVGQDGDTHYIVMAYVPGESLAELLKARKTPMPPRQAALVVRKLALALEAAHAKGVIHRDLKPGNILFDKDRKEMVITDFGLARRIRKDEARLTQSGVIMGTPAYMAPEQARGSSKEVGPCSDVYSLGVILYELLAGRRPFNGSVAEVIGEVLHVEPEPPSKHRRDLDPALEAICLKAMAKKTEQRYRSMKEFADALNDYLKGTAPAEAKSVASVPSSAGTVVRQEAELLRELSREHREETAKAVKEAIKGARVPFWAWLAGSGLTGVLVLLGILFFVRGGSATVIIQVPLPPGIDLKDTTLSFFLDGKEIAGEELEKPIELKPGDHELLIKRGEQVVKRMLFTVIVKGKDVTVEVKEPPPPPPVDYVALFNGKDLTGWKTHPDDPEGNWRVENGVLVASGKVLKPCSLFTDRGDYQDFHFFVEARINEGGNSGQFFRCKFMPGINPGGYEAQINSTHSDPIKTGSLYKLANVSDVLVKPGEWFTQEVIAQGNRIIIKVNGKTTADYVDTENRSTRGHLALQLHLPRVTVAEFRVVKVKELKPEAGPAEAGWQPLFNGKDLDGWEVDGDKQGWNVKDAAIVTVPNIPGRGWLFTRQEFVDFELRLEFALSFQANSGLAVRATPGEGGGNRLQLEIQLRDDANHPRKHITGSIIPTGIDSIEPPTPPTLKPLGEWNEMRLTARGSVLKVEVNGEAAHEVDLAKVDPGSLQGDKEWGPKNLKRQRGRIGLQYASKETKFRNIRVKELKVANPPVEKGWQSLFNGKDLDGWDGAAPCWSVQNDMIVGAYPPGPREHNFLHSKKSYRDFELRFQARLKDNLGNSGVHFRSKVAAKTGFWVHGPQCEITKVGHSIPSGSLVSSPDGATLILADKDLVAKLQKPDDFNDFYIKCVGKHVLVRLNGQTVVDKEVPTIPDEGILAWQMHAGVPADITLKNVELRDLSPPVSADPERAVAELIQELGGYWRGTVGNAGHEGKAEVAMPVGIVQIRLVGLEGRPGVTDAVAARLASLKAVTVLDVQGSVLTDAGVRHLAGLTGLRQLNVSRTAITDDSLPSLNGMTELEALGLNEIPRITDEGMVKVTGLRNLRVLSLIGCPIDGTGLAHFRSVEHLELNNCKVNDAGLAALAKLTNLKDLRLVNCPVTEAGLATFKKAVPECKVTR